MSYLELVPEGTLGIAVGDGFGITGQVVVASFGGLPLLLPGTGIVGVTGVCSLAVIGSYEDLLVETEINWLCSRHCLLDPLGWPLFFVWPNVEGGLEQEEDSDKETEGSGGLSVLSSISMVNIFSLELVLWSENT